MNTVAMGKAGLTGVKGKVAQRVAGPVAERTRLSRDQVEALLGAAFLALSLWQFLRVARRVVAAGRST